ncbi:MAG: acylphosphatase [Methanosarcinales archaeon]|nr:acylphosphatase [Methanosarcinales archaeon]
MMKKVTLYISGNVQRVGYRAKVISIATALGIKVDQVTEKIDHNRIATTISPHIRIIEVKNN